MLSPLLRILHVNGVIKRIRNEMEKEILPNNEWRIAAQLLADDISAAISHKDQRTVAALAEHLARILLKV